MRKLVSILFILFINWLLTSCHRQLLEDWYYTKAMIPISVDWSVCDVNPQNVSVFFFNESDGKIVLQHYYENNNNQIQSYVEIPVGKYTVLVFNELPGQIVNLNIDNINNFNTILAKGKKATNVSLPIENDIYLDQPGQLASVIVRHFEVNDDMVYYTNNISLSNNIILDEKLDENLEHIKALMNLVPLRNLSQFKMQLHVLGLNNARMPALINLRNVSESYIFDNNSDGITPVTYQSTTNNRIYDNNNKKDGIVSCDIDLFGVLGNRSSMIDQSSIDPIILDIRFMLIDKERTIVQKSFDITNLIKFELQNNGTMLLLLDLNDSVPLPDVVPESSGGESGFDTSVEDWEVIDVPLPAQ